MLFRSDSVIVVRDDDAVLVLEDLVNARQRARDFATRCERRSENERGLTRRKELRQSVVPIVTSSSNEYVRQVSNWGMSRSPLNDDGGPLGF